MAKAKNLDGTTLFEDPLVQKIFEDTGSMVDGVWTVNRIPRYKAVRNHEKQHRIHAKLNYNSLKDTLSAYESTTFDSNEACETAAAKKLSEAWDQFKKDEDEWAAKVEKGEYPE